MPHTPSSPDPDLVFIPGLSGIESALAQRAEEVRAWLVTLRGGAPFLSAEDGRILLRWLDRGIPVATLQAAIERVANRRAGRRTRTRLTLSACRAEVRKATRPTEAGAGKRIAEDPALHAHSAVPKRTDLKPMADRLREHAACGEAENDLPFDQVKAALARLADRLASLSGSDPDAAARAAITACREFHESTWASLADTRQDALRTQIRTELAPVEDSMGAAVFTELVEEMAHSRVRGWFPLVSAQEVWDTLNRTDP